MSLIEFIYQKTTIDDRDFGKNNNLFSQAVRQLFIFN